MSYKCPICGKAGLNDYRDKHQICPQCNSDLKPYLLLNSINKSRKSNLYITSAILLIFIIVFFYMFSSSISKKDALTNQYNQELLSLEDSIKLLNYELMNYSQVPDLSNEIVITYKVKKGDYPAKIAEFFYNDWRMYKKIEQDNSLTQPYVLIVGQPIIIKLLME